MDWEQRLVYPDGTFGKFVKRGNIRRYKLIAGTTQHNLVKGIEIEGMGYNQVIPGPLLLFKQGEIVEIEVINQLNEPTALHVHGLSKPNSQDGIPDIEPTPSIKPGSAFTYRFVAWQSGTFFYHSSDPSQITHGLLGPFVVLPSQNSQMPYLDYVMLLQQWEINQLDFGDITPGLYKLGKFDRHPNFFTINGKAFPETSPVFTKFNEKVRMRFINKSSASHTMHIHGHDFRLVEVNGFSRQNIFDDTIDVPSANRIDIEFLSNNPGVFPINGTKVFHQTNNGHSPGGMITRLIYTN